MKNLCCLLLISVQYIFINLICILHVSRPGSEDLCKNVHMLEPFCDANRNLGLEQSGGLGKSAMGATCGGGGKYVGKGCV